LGSLTSLPFPLGHTNSFSRLLSPPLSPNNPFVTHLNLWSMIKRTPSARNDATPPLFPLSQRTEPSRIREFLLAFFSFPPPFFFFSFYGVASSFWIYPPFFTGPHDPLFSSFPFFFFFFGGIDPLVSTDNESLPLFPKKKAFSPPPSTMKTSRKTPFRSPFPPNRRPVPVGATGFSLLFFPPSPPALFQGHRSCRPGVSYSPSSCVTRIFLGRMRPPPFFSTGLRFSYCPPTFVYGGTPFEKKNSPKPSPYLPPLVPSYDIP